MKKGDVRLRGIWWGGFLLLFGFLMSLVWADGLFALDRSTDQLLSLFETVFSYVQDHYVEEPDPEVLLEGALEGLFESLDDPYSEYLSEEELRDLSDTTRGEFGGIGLYIAKETSNGGDAGYVDVVAPIEGTPAYRAGILAGDKIIGIEGESTMDLSIDEVLSRLRGEPGTQVTITIKRGGDYVFDVTLTRAIIQVPTVRYEFLPEHKVGILRIIQFTPHTPEKVEEAISAFKEQGYRGLLIDVRSNPGGLLDSVLEITDFFFREGIMLREEGRTSEATRTYYATGDLLVDEDIPVVVLVNRGTASAAEILSGVLKDRGRGTLVGETTYGKGSVQQVQLLPRGGFRLTVARYYTPSGVVIDKHGIEPDVTVEEETFTEDQMALYGELLSSGRITEFVVSHDVVPSEEAIRSFISRLASERPEYDPEILRRLIHAEVVRRSTHPPLYDPDYDRVMQEGMRILLGLMGGET